MPYIRQHIIFRILTILLVGCVLMPSAFKLAHAFSHTNHQHEVCLGEKQIHLHALDVNCEFHKFQLNTAFTLPVNAYHFLVIQENHSLIHSQYYFISEFQQLHFNLRGPPRTS
ncbi:hypothetical protein [Bizionia arctica]|uniref:hypothetical protein n=1 Tax=Bizionia arctica TaxID=1495645 RepID=UPI001E5E3926|nr:hypothetical protein [Bizionia arctica]